MYVLLSGLGTTLRGLLPLRRHVPLSVFYRLVKALLKHFMVILGSKLEKEIIVDCILSVMFEKYPNPRKYIK